MNPGPGNAGPARPGLAGPLAALGSGALAALLSLTIACAPVGASWPGRDGVIVYVAPEPGRSTRTAGDGEPQVSSDGRLIVFRFCSARQGPTRRGGLRDAQRWLPCAPARRRDRPGRNVEPTFKADGARVLFVRIHSEEPRRQQGDL